MTENIDHSLRILDTEDYNKRIISTTSSDTQEQSIDRSSGAGTPSNHPPQVTTTTTTNSKKVTFWSLPRELRDMIWDEVLPSEDEIFPANISCGWGFEDIETLLRRRDPATQPQGFDGLEYDPLVFSCRPPALAHVCREFREDAVRRYESAYRKLYSSTQPISSYPSVNELFLEERWGLQWLSRRVARYVVIGLFEADFELYPDELEDLEMEHGSQALSRDGDELEVLPLGQDNIQETIPFEDDDNAEMDDDEQGWLAAITCDQPTWEDYLEEYENAVQQTPYRVEGDVLALRCLWTSRQPMTISSFVRSALLDLLAKAEDYQIMVICDFPGYYSVAPLCAGVMEKWSAFADRAPGFKFDQYGYPYRRLCFVDIRDIDQIIDFVDFVRLYWNIDNSEEEDAVEALLNNTELRERLTVECLEPFETLWAEGGTYTKWSRYGRMPKIGVVVNITRL